MTPNRVATVLGAVGALLVGLVPIVADMDWQSTAGVVTGIAAATALLDRWLRGWQAHEARHARMREAGRTEGW